MFRDCNFIGHSGDFLGFKIECDDLSDQDIRFLARLVNSKFKFGAVEGIPTGGNRFAEALQEFVTTGPTLIVDDVLTTGKSMNAARKAVSDRGVVIFARGPCPEWVTPIFTMNPLFTDFICQNF